MKKARVLAKKAAWQRQSVSSSWETQPVPLRPALRYLTLPVPAADDSGVHLLCDPLTGLVAYPSFESQMIGGRKRLSPAVRTVPSMRSIPQPTLFHLGA